MRRDVLAGARRADHRRARSDDIVARGAHARAGRATRWCSPRAAPSSRRRAWPTCSRTSTSRSRSGRSGEPCSGYGMPHRPGQRPGRARARPEGRPAARLPPARRSRGARARWRRVWGVSPERSPGPGQVGLRAARRARPRRRRARAARHRLELRSSRRRMPTHIEERLRVARLASSSPTSSCPRPRALADVVLPSAQWAEEEGTMTNLEGRVLRRRQVVDAAAGRAHRHRDPQWPRRARSARRAAFRTTAAATCSTSCGRATRRRRRPTTRASPTSASTRATACSGRARRRHTPGTPRLFADRFPDADRPRALPPRRATGAGRDARTPSTRSTSRPAACWRSTSRARRRAASPAAVDAARRSRRRDASARRPTRSGVADGAAITIETRRGARVVPLEADARHPRGHHLRAVSLGRRAVGQPADQRRRSIRSAGCRSSRCARRACDASRSNAARHAHAIGRARTPSKDDTRMSTTATGRHRQRHGGRPARRGGRRARRPAIASTSRCSATSRTATTTASCSRACSPAPTSPRTSSSTRSPGTHEQRRHAARRRRASTRIDRDAQRVVRRGRPRRALRHAGHRHRQQRRSSRRSRACVDRRTGDYRAGRLRVPHARRLRRASLRTRRDATPRRGDRRRAARPRSGARPARTSASRCTSCT